MKNQKKTKGQLEDELIAEKNKAQYYLDIAGVILLVLDQNQEVKLINKKGCEILGGKEHEILGLNWFDNFIPSEQVKNVKSVFKKILAGEIEPVEYFENPIIRLNGEQRIIAWHNTMLKDDKGRLIGILSSGEDITERKQAEEALHHSHEEWISTFNAISNWVSLIEVKTQKIIRTNQAGSTLLGIPTNKIVGQPCYKLVHGYGDCYPDCPLMRVLDSRQRESKEIYQQEHNRWLQIIVDPIIEEDGNLVNVVHIVSDITERKIAEENLQEYSNKLEEMVEDRTRDLLAAHEKIARQERLAVLGELAGSVGHELRNPLGVITNACYYLNMTLSDIDQKAKEHLQLIDAEVKNAAKIVSDLLDFARIKSADRSPIDISELLSATLNRYPTPDSVSLKIKMPDDLPKVNVDSFQIQQVFGNIFINAYQAMPEGGKLYIEAHQHGKFVRLAIRDTGVGIPHNDLDKIFEPLFTTKQKGIGLGLAISKNLVEANGGNIELESTSETGTVIKISLPEIEGRNEPTS